MPSSRRTIYATVFCRNQQPDFCIVRESTMETFNNVQTNEIEPIATLYQNVLHHQHQQQRVNLQ